MRKVVLNKLKIIYLIVYRYNNIENMENTQDCMQSEDMKHVMEYEGADCIVEDDKLLNPSLIIMDWDDTLFPTNIVYKNIVGLQNAIIIFAIYSRH